MHRADVTQRPRVDPSAFVHPTAVIIGDVEVGPESSVWPHAVVRADVAPVSIARAVNVQDGAVLHADPGGACALSDRVTVGHRAVVHGARVGPDTIVGMGAIVLERAVVGSGCVIAAGAVVREGEVVPDGALVAGVPARVVRTDPAFGERARVNALRYAALVPRYLAGEFCEWP